MRIFRLILPIVAVLLEPTVFAGELNTIDLGDRLVIKLHSAKAGGSGVWVIESDGTIQFGGSARVQVRGLSTDDAAAALRNVVYVVNGDKLLVQDASVRKIGPLPPPLRLSVFQENRSNVVFRLMNSTTNTFRLPSDGYGQGGYELPINTNPAYALVTQPEVGISLFVTRDWRYIGPKWMSTSRDAWGRHLRIRALNPGDHLDLRAISCVSTLMKPYTNLQFRFEFSIPQEFAEEYDLWEGSISVTRTAKELEK